MSKLEKTFHPAGELNASAVFIHGIDGHSRGTWQSGPNGQSFWPDWLAADIRGLAIWTVGYEAPVSRWTGSAMHLTDRAKNVLELMLAAPELSQGQLILIGHSLGGLVIKQLIRTAESEAKNRQDTASFLDRVHKIIFLATPHSGSGLATWGDRLRILIRPSAAAACLVRNDHNLCDLNLWYRDWTNNRTISHLVLTETRSTSIFGMIVKPDSSDMGIATRPVPVDCNHWDISKPSGRDSFIYSQVRAFIERRVERIPTAAETAFGQLSQGQKALFDQHERMIELLQSEKGIGREALLGHLVRIGAREDIRSEDIPKFLEQFADEFPKLQEQLRKNTTGNPEILSVRQHVADLLDRGALDEARAHLAQARAQMSLQLEHLREQEAGLLSDEARIDQLELNYRTAAGKFGMAAAMAAFNSEAAFAHTLEQGRSLQSQGTEYGDNTALAEAINVFRLAAEARPRHVAALDWALAQHHQGIALALIGTRESDPARLKEALVAFQEALKERTRDRVPLDWAASQNGLGNALLRLGERESDPTQLKEAVVVYREVLKERTRDRVPLDWAATQNNLGNALLRLGERESDPAQLKEAVDAYEQALKEYTRARVPVKWAATQNNLGNALLRLGHRESDPARLKRAIIVYEVVLEEYTRDRVPLKWAATQSNLGNALSCLGERESNPARLKEAVSAYREALKEYKRDAAPLEWASTQKNLGITLLRLGERERDSARLKEAVAACHEALKEKTRQHLPLDWAATQGILGETLLRLGERENDSALLREAIGACREALKERTRQDMPLDWAATQNNLGNALLKLGERETNPVRLKEAVEAYQKALKEYKRDCMPRNWADLQNNLGGALTLLGERTNDPTRLMEAVGAYREALKERTRELEPVEWARTQYNLGSVHLMLGERLNDQDRLRQAVAAYQEVMTIFTRQNAPLDWARSVVNQGMAAVLISKECGDMDQAEAILIQMTVAVNTLSAGGDANTNAYQRQFFRAREIVGQLRAQKHC